MRALVKPLMLLLGLTWARLATAEEALVAVAASFLPPIQALAAEFEQATGHDIGLASGSTGALYAQIVNGAPFDVFIAADAERPRLLAEAGLGLEASRATIAVGRLVLFGTDAALIDAEGLDALTHSGIRHVAIANPRVAPYGVAAQQTLEALDLWGSLEGRLVRGESVAQAYAMVATGNAELGLVALAQVRASHPNRGAYVLVPERYYAPIRQDLIILRSARDNPAAAALREFILSVRAKSTLATFGYVTDGR